MIVVMVHPVDFKDVLMGILKRDLLGATMAVIDLHVAGQQFLAILGQLALHL